MSIKRHPGYEPVVNPEELLRKVDQKLFDLYRGGAQLCVWRNSSPHNWWLSEPGNRDAIIYHWDEGMRPSEAFLAFSRRVGSNEEIVAYRGGFPSGFDAGMRTADAWLYDEAVYQARVAHWNQAQDAARTFKEMAGTLPVDLTALSTLGQQIVRGLKKGNRYPLDPMNLATGELLCRMGLAEITAYAFIEATSMLRRLKVPTKMELDKLTASRAQAQPA